LTQLHGRLEGGARQIQREHTLDEPPSRE
jgi:hypothetical protein